MSKIFIYGNKNLLKNYSYAVKHFKHQPIISTNLSLSVNCDGLILAGGGDVYPYFYGQKNRHAIHTDIKRDLAEFSLINHFYQKNLPILGICRGMQILNVFFGGTLRQKLKYQSVHFGKFDVYHKVETSKLLPTKKQTFTVNSAHRQGVFKLGKNLFATLYSQDKTVEMFVHKNSKIIGVQFHPERLLNTDQTLGELFLKFFFNQIKS